MGLRKLAVADFRCIADGTLEFNHGRNFIIGANGAGKTSLLESIHILGRGRSFRTRQARRLVRRGSKGFSVYGELASEGDRALAGAGRRVGVAFGAGKLEGRIDGRPIESIAELAVEFPVHVLDPQVHGLVEAGPSERRRFLDAGVFHVEPEYLARWRLYRRLLGQRNAALKAGHADQLTEVWTEKLAEAGETVHSCRERYLQGLSRRVAAAAERLLGWNVELRYAAGWPADASLAEILARGLERDRRMGFTQAGPHRADLELRFEAGAVRDAASRGQQKLVAAALVLAQVAEFEGVTGRSGTLLIDDPAAELDQRALERLLGEVGRLRAQTVISGLRLEVLMPDATDPVFHVEQGKVERVV